jgi:sporulation protein YlmC with PRC-barrel domain
MKRFLLLSILSIFCLTINAQNFLFTGNGDGITWHDPNNWNPQQVPGAVFNQVTIPSGMTVTNGGTIVFNFGNIVGGGTIINNASFTFLGQGSASKSLNNISFINNATILNDVPGIGTVLTGGAIITNTSTGTITFNGPGITSNSPNDKLINDGGIIRNIHPGSLQLQVILENNNGTIIVENGDLYWATGANSDFNYLQDGTYNVAQGSTLWLGDFTLGGTFTGQIDGAFGLVGTGNNIFKVTSTLTNNLSGNGLTFYFGGIIGGGTIINNTKFNITNDGGGLSKSINNIEIINNGEFNSVFSNNNTGWGLSNDSQITNTPSGTMNIGLGFLGNTGTESIQNNGTIIITNDVGIGVNLTNNGLLNYGTSNLTFAFSGVQINNTIDGTILGTGQLDLNFNTSFLNNGIVTSGPGANKVFIYNGFRQDANARLIIDINGNTPETDYDVIQADNGGAFDMNGTIVVNLGFAPALDDEFTVLFSVNRAVICGLPSNVSAVYQGMQYTFDVICGGNSVILKVSNIVLDIEEYNLSTTMVYPNPTHENFTIDLGKNYPNITVKLVNMLGQIVSTKNYISAKTIEQEINTSAGLYFIKISTDAGASKTLKIIKQ